MSAHSKPTFNIPGIMSFYSSLIILSICAIFAFCIQQDIIQYDKADILSFALLFFVPMLASWGVGFGIIGLKRRGSRKIFAIAGTAINATIIGWIFILWLRLFLFLSSFKGWID